MAYVSTAKASPTPLPMLAWWVVTPHHVAHNLKHLFLKHFNGRNAISKNCCLISLLRCKRFEWKHVRSKCEHLLTLVWKLVKLQTIYKWIRTCNRRQPSYKSWGKRVLEVCKQTYGILSLRSWGLRVGLGCLVHPCWPPGCGTDTRNPRQDLPAFPLSYHPCPEMTNI